MRVLSHLEVLASIVVYLRATDVCIDHGKRYSRSSKKPFSITCNPALLYHIHFIITQWLLTPTDSVNKGHHELLTPPDHMNLCTRVNAWTMQRMSSSMTEDAYIRTAYEELMKYKTN